MTPAFTGLNFDVVLNYYTEEGKIKILLDMEMVRCCVFIELKLQNLLKRINIVSEESGFRDNKYKQTTNKGCISQKLKIL